MTVRTTLRLSLLAGLAVLGVAGVGCSDSASLTDLPGLAKITQVMVLTPSTTPVNKTGPDLLADGLSKFELTYGSQFQYNLCALDANEDHLGDCPKTAQGLQLTCATTGDLKGHCVDAATGKSPIVKFAVPNAAEIRVVVGTLLDGKTLEDFACACQGDTLATIKESNCPAGGAWNNNPRDCSACPATAAGDTSTQGKCVDTDNNGIPDVSALKPDLATITCGATVLSLGRGEGYFYPSGDQVQSSRLGLAGLGPAIVLDPAMPLPTNSDCSVGIAAAVKDKKGSSLADPGESLLFHTDTLGFPTLSPKNGASVPATTASLSLTANAPLAPATLTAANFVVALDGGAAVAGTTVALATGSTTKVTITIPASPGLAPESTYTVTVSKAVTDTYGKGLSADLTYSFDTDPAN